MGRVIPETSVFNPLGKRVPYGPPKSPQSQEVLDAMIRGVSYLVAKAKADKAATAPAPLAAPSQPATDTAAQGLSPEDLAALARYTPASPPPESVALAALGLERLPVALAPPQIVGAQAPGGAVSQPTARAVLPPLRIPGAAPTLPSVDAALASAGGSGVPVAFTPGVPEEVFLPPATPESPPMTREAALAAGRLMTETGAVPVTRTPPPAFGGGDRVPGAAVALPPSGTVSVGEFTGGHVEAVPIAKVQAVGRLLQSRDQAQSTLARMTLLRLQKKLADGSAVLVDASGKPVALRSQMAGPTAGAPVAAPVAVPAAAPMPEVAPIAAVRSPAAVSALRPTPTVPSGTGAPPVPANVAPLPEGAVPPEEEALRRQVYENRAKRAMETGTLTDEALAAFEAERAGTAGPSVLPGELPTTLAGRMALAPYARTMEDRARLLGGVEELEDVGVPGVTGLLDLLSMGRDSAIANVQRAKEAREKIVGAFPKISAADPTEIYKTLADIAAREEQARLYAAQAAAQFERDPTDAAQIELKRAQKAWYEIRAEHERVKKAAAEKKAAGGGGPSLSDTRYLEIRNLIGDEAMRSRETIEARMTQLLNEGDVGAKEAAAFYKHPLVFGKIGLPPDRPPKAQEPEPDVQAVLDDAGVTAADTKDAANRKLNEYADRARKTGTLDTKALAAARKVYEGVEPPKPPRGPDRQDAAAALRVVEDDLDDLFLAHNPDFVAMGERGITSFDAVGRYVPTDDDNDNEEFTQALFRLRKAYQEKWLPLMRERERLRAIILGAAAPAASAAPTSQSVTTRSVRGADAR